MLKLFICSITTLPLFCHLNNEIKIQAQNWHYIQQQLAYFYEQYAHLQTDKQKNNQEFFNIQQQLGALYFAQKRYHAGYGTALFPSECAVHNYVRKKTFITLKLKELLPLYKNHALEYQKKYAPLEKFDHQKQIEELEERHSFYLKKFKEIKAKHKISTEIKAIEKVSSIHAWVKKQPFHKIQKSSRFLNWITPVAGIKPSSSQATWSPLENAVILCPDIGVVTAIGELSHSIAICIKQNHFTYVISGISQCCVNKGDTLKQGDLIGFSAAHNPALVELQLWRDDIILDPSPYYKSAQL